MAQATANWEKSASKDVSRLTKKRGRWQFLVGGLLILGAVAYLIINSTFAGARYFITVDELLQDESYIGQTVRISGAVPGDTIQYDPETLTIQFEIAHIPGQFDDLAAALHEAVNNPNAARIPIVVENQPMPDLLQHEAQAILTGQLRPDGTFYATELLLKCPSRFEEAGPDQSLISDSSA